MADGASERQGLGLGAFACLPATREGKSHTLEAPQSQEEGPGWGQATRLPRDPPQPVLSLPEAVEAKRGQAL